MAGPSPNTQFKFGHGDAQGCSTGIYVDGLSLPVEIWGDIASSITTVPGAFEIEDHDSIVAFMRDRTFDCTASRIETALKTTLALVMVNRWMRDAITPYRFRHVCLGSPAQIERFKTTLEKNKRLAASVWRIDVVEDPTNPMGLRSKAGNLDKKNANLCEIVEMCPNLKCYSNIFSNSIPVLYTRRLLQFLTQKSSVQRIEISFDLNYRKILEHALAESRVKVLWLRATKCDAHPGIGKGSNNCETAIGENKENLLPSAGRIVLNDIQLFASWPSRDAQSEELILPDVKTCVLGRSYSTGPVASPRLKINKGVSFLACDDVETLGALVQPLEKLSVLSIAYKELTLVKPSSWKRLAKPLVETLVIEAIAFDHYPSFQDDLPSLIERLTASLGILTAKATFPNLKTIKLCLPARSARANHSHPRLQETIFWMPWNRMGDLHRLRFRAAYGEEEWTTNTFTDIIIHPVSRLMQDAMLYEPHWWTIDPAL